MSPIRLKLVIFIALVVASTVIFTRIYELNVISGQRMQTVVKPGYKVFRKETNGFIFHYPSEWSYRSVLNEPDFTNGFLVDDRGTKQLYLEVPYIGHSFIVRTEGSKVWYSPTIFDKEELVKSVSTTYFKANDPVTSIALSMFRPCSSASSTACIPAKNGGFMAAYWQRGKDAPVLSVNNISAQTGVIYHEIDRDEPEDAAFANLSKIISTLNFRDPYEQASSTMLHPKIYYNYQGDFMIHYPAAFSLKENTDLSFVYMATGTAISYPTEFSTGTNLSEAKILIGYVLPQYAAQNCLPQDNISTEGEPVTVNGVVFSKSVGAGAAAGNRYDTITLGTKRYDKCFNVTLFLHSTVLENYPENMRPRPFDRDKVLTSFYNIIDSLMFDL